MYLPFLLADDQAETIVIVPLRPVRRREVESVRKALTSTYRLNVEVAPSRRLPKAAYYPPRHRYRAEHLDAWLSKAHLGDRVIGVTDTDLSTTARGHKDWGIAGLALGSTAVASSFRAKDKIDEVAVHEIGHTLGLPHCPNAGCVMQDAKGKIARIGTHFCPACRAKIAAFLR